MRYAFCVAEDISLGVGYLLSYLKSQGHEVKLFFDPKQFDRGYFRNEFLRKMFCLSSNMVDAISSYNPDGVCISVVTAHYQWGLSLAREIKEKVGCKIIFGGVHPTLVPDEVRKHDFIDDVVVGDGIKYFGGEFNPDKIFPEREMFFKELPPEHRKIQLFMTSFGCPFNCTYCGNQQLRAVNEHKIIKRSVEGCIKELKQLKANGAKYILFVDDIFTMHKTWLKRFLDIYKQEIGLPFSCFVHPRFIRNSIVRLLKKSGCQSAWMGIQTGDQDLRMEVLERYETNEEIIKACKLIRRYKIKLIVDHIFGIPFETEESMKKSEDLYKKIKPDIVNCYQLLYFPKAKIIDHALNYEYLGIDQVKEIEQGKGIVYQTNNKGQKYYDEYVKQFVSIPLGQGLFKFLPITLIKILVFIRAGRAFTLIAIIQNEIFFTWRAICKKYLKKSTIN